jgi:type II secretory pathway pseudopilin PulG
MQIKSFMPPRKAVAGFTLPAILVVVGALLILAVASLLIIGIERNTARSYTDRQRAELATQAGLDDFRRILKQQTAKDDFMIVQGTEENPAVTTKEITPYLYVARGSVTNGGLNYDYQPLFSTETTPPSTQILTPPRPESLVGNEPKSFNTLPWFDPAKVSWVTIKDPSSKIVSRYAYWVEDLQGKIDGRIAGNPNKPSRATYPLPSGMPVDEDLPPLSSIEVGAIDPKATDQSLNSAAGNESLAQTMVSARPAMLSPDSIIGATDILKTSQGSDSAKPALVRNTETGLLENPIAAAIEREVSPVLQPYKEQALVPHSLGIAPILMGQPKMNLNRLLKGTRSGAVRDFAQQINDGLPEFENNRKGGFPDQYLETLAASALDYADQDNDPTISPGAYVGQDGYPFISEIVLQINFLGSSRVAGRDIQRWNFRLFVELWNMTNQTVNGSASFSYEVDLRPEAMGAGSSGTTQPFDSPGILNDRTLSTHNLENRQGTFYTSPQAVSLLPDQYKFYDVASVNYTLPDASGGQRFGLIEPPYSSGMTLQWNGQPVHVIAKIVRDTAGLTSFENRLAPITEAKATIPGHGYGSYGSQLNNMGDPRISHYLRNMPNSENTYPGNVSPGRRNVRRLTIYDSDSAEKRTAYGRVLPSEWPDGGHDSPITPFPVPPRDPKTRIPTDTSNATGWPVQAPPIRENAVQRLSNFGLFYSATELGNIYDPLMWKPTYGNSSGSGASGSGDTAAIQAGFMPAGRNSWPDVSNGSSPSVDYGGGNTLRIGRPEHERFDRAGRRASQLLDLFHAGIPNSTDSNEREGNLVQIKGNINVNTAGRTALRAMAAGFITQDPELRRVTSWAHDTGTFRPQTTLLELGAPSTSILADQIADAIILRRPFSSTAELAAIRDLNDVPVFGNRELYPYGRNIQWSDAAAEEVFSRVYDASSVRSRNFRVWVIGQAITGTEDKPVILSESRKAFTVFADPGERKNDGSIDPIKYQPRVTYENDF